MSTGRSLAVVLASVISISASTSTHAGLIGVDWGTGELYDVSTTDASLTVIASTGIVNLGALAMGPDNQLYAFNAGPSATLYRIDPSSFAVTPIGPLGLFAFEGAMTITPAGIAYAFAAGSAQDPQLLQIDLATGTATPLVTLDGDHDINGLAWRDDGILVGLDRYANGLVEIDPATGVVTTLAPIAAAVGSSGGMASIGNTGYFATGAPGGSVAGSNRLYSFDLLTGSPVLINTFAPAPLGEGISGLAIPEPATLASMLLLLIPFKARRPSNC